MTVHDLWKDLSKAEIAERRKANRDRWQRRWREGAGRNAPQRKQSYKEHQKAQAHIDDAAQMNHPRAQQLRVSTVTVQTLIDRHLAAKADRAPKTVEADQHHARAVCVQFGERVFSTLEPTEIEIWAQREGVARSSRKKQVEILRAAIKRAIRDKLVDSDPTDGIVVPLGHKELPHWSSEELMTVAAAARDDFDRALLLLLGLVGVRFGEARSLRIADLRDGHISVINSGGGSDQTKTRASRRTLPVPAAVLPLLENLTEGRVRSEWIFSSNRNHGEPIGETYANGALTRAVARANLGREERISRLNVHGLRHTFAAIALSEAEADVLSVSRAMGHSRPSVTLDRYGHLAPAGLAPLMSKIDDVVASRSPSSG